VLEDRRADRLDEDTEELAEMIAELGALDVYVLPAQAGGNLIEAREKASGRPRRPAPTTSSTWSSPAPRFPTTWRP